jgi:hypothetical protein
LGAADASKLEASMKALNFDASAVHLRDLIDAFRLGVAAHLDDLKNDPERERRFGEASRFWFSSLDQAKMDTLQDVWSITA